jgi:hypothetical protein
MKARKNVPLKEFVTLLKEYFKRCDEKKNAENK